MAHCLDGGVVLRPEGFESNDRVLGITIDQRLKPHFVSCTFDPWWADALGFFRKKRNERPGCLFNRIEQPAAEIERANLMKCGSGISD
jgi:hypothetical protein